MNTHIHEFLQDPEKGCNCQLFSAAITRARGFFLPDTYRSSEIYEDLDFTEVIFSPQEMKTGDILGLTTQENRNPKKLHLGIVYVDASETQYLIHSAKDLGKATISLLHDLQEDKKYNKLACIKRPIIRLDDNDYQSLQQLGLEFLMT